jgi:hypothetical protein
VLAVEDAVDVVSVVAVVRVTVTAFISGTDMDSVAATSCKPADANVVFSAAAVVSASALMFKIV